MMWKKWPEFREAIKNRRVIYWGAGEWVEKTLRYSQPNSAFIIDNSQNEQGTRDQGMRVYGPDKLSRVLKQKDRYYLVITSTDFYNVSKQIESYGLKPGKNFCVTPALINHKILMEMRTYSQKVLISSSDPDVDSETKGGGIYLYDTGRMKAKKLVAGVTHGFALLNDHYYLVDDNLGIRVFNRQFTKEINRFKLPQKCRPHGVAVDQKKNQLFIAFTMMDAVAVYSAKTGRQLDLISVSDKYRQSKVAWHQVNDVCTWQDSLYISMFSRSGNWIKGVFDGTILEYDLKRKKILGPVVSQLWMPHSVKMIEGKLCYVDSMRGDLHHSSHKIASRFNGFIRGLAYDGKFYLVGQSVHRYFDRMLGFSNNIAQDCGFFIFDDETKASKFYSMPHLLDIHALDIYRD